MKNLGVRTLSGAVLLAVVLAAIWLRGPLLVVVIAAAVALGAHEFYTMMRKAGYQPWYPAGIALALLLAMRSYLGGDLLTGVTYSGPSEAPEVLALTFVVVLLLARQGLAWLGARSWGLGAGIDERRPTSSLRPGQADRRRRTTDDPRPTTGETQNHRNLGDLGGSWRLGGEGTGPRPLAPSPYPAQSGQARSPYLAWTDLGLTLAGAIYTGGLLGYAPMLASIQESPVRGGGLVWMLLVLLGTAACDSAAYFVGSLLGRHKMIPHVSPGKTWEGLVGGVLGAIVAALVLSSWLRTGWLESIALGIVICVAAVTGDLAESLLKRAAGVKDSGNLIPGHGGMLDRADSVLFVILAVFWFVTVRG